MANVLVALAMTQFEKARAKLQAHVGRFFMYRDLLLNLKDRADYLARKAEKTGNAALASSIKSLRPRLDEAYNRQVHLENQVQGALSKISAVQSGAADQSAQPTTIASAASLLLQTAASVAVHEKTVDGLASLIKTVESKSLTAAEAARVRSGGSFGAGISAAGAMMLAGVAVLGFWLFRRRSR